MQLFRYDQQQLIALEISENCDARDINNSIPPQKNDTTSEPACPEILHKRVLIPMETACTIEQSFCGDFVSVLCLFARLCFRLTYTQCTHSSSQTLSPVSAKYPTLGSGGWRHHGVRCLDMQGEYPVCIYNSTCAVHLTIITTTTGWGLSSPLSSILCKRHTKKYHPLQ